MPASEPGPFARFLAQALAALLREGPGCHAQIADAVGPAGVSLLIDTEAIWLRADGDALRLDVGPPVGAEVEVRTSRATILALAEGNTSLVTALESDRLYVRGTLDAVLRFDTALLAFFEGAVRAPSLPPMLDRLRDGTLQH